MDLHCLSEDREGSRIQAQGTWVVELASGPSCPQVTLYILFLSVDVNLQGVFFPPRQTSQALSHFILDGPAPGLKEWSQILLHFFRELPHPQIHLASVVFGDAGKGLVLSKELGEWLPPKDLLELRRERRGRMRHQVSKSNGNMLVHKYMSFTALPVWLCG